MATHYCIRSIFLLHHPRNFITCTVYKYRLFFLHETIGIENSEFYKTCDEQNVNSPLLQPHISSFPPSATSPLPSTMKIWILFHPYRLHNLRHKFSSEHRLLNTSKFRYNCHVYGTGFNLHIIMCGDYHLHMNDTIKQHYSYAQWRLSSSLLVSNIFSREIYIDYI